LLAVTKTHPLKTLKKAAELGVQHFGENRVQEAEKKAPHIPNNIELHLIGHLQSNKIKKALKIFNVIQTVDSLKLAEKINQQAKALNKKQRIYCQVNIGKDPNKTGFTARNLKSNIKKIISLSNLSTEGIMTILPQNEKNKTKTELYKKTKKIRDEISKSHKIDLELSMGMSEDYKIAIECGATIIRVGTKLFGTRK
tara:strand:+ start:387 stop:977 length:591 start_codon:yes stop_codon:yes gene_type:complete